MAGITEHLTRTAVALIFGIASIALFMENYTNYNLTFRMLMVAGICCLVGGCAPDIDHQSSVPAKALWSLMLTGMSFGFLRIYLENIDLLIPGISVAREASLMFMGLIIMVPITDVIFGVFQDFTTHRQALHHFLKTAGLTATLGMFVLPVSHVNGGMDLLIERSIYLLSFQYGVVIHIILDTSRVVKFFVALLP